MENQSLTQKKEISLDEKFSTKSYLFRTFFHGLILILPTVIILFLLSLIFKFVFNLVSPISSLLNGNAEKNTFLMNILALLILLAFIFIIGLVLRNTTRKRYFKSFESKYLLQIPLYSTVQEIIAQFTGLKKMPFSQVVLVDAFNTGVLLTGFVTETIAGDIFTVFVPTAPNPMNGNIYHVPAAQLKFLEIEPEKAMRSIVGMGTGSSVLFAAKYRSWGEEDLSQNDHISTSAPLVIPS